MFEVGWNGMVLRSENTFRERPVKQQLCFFLQMAICLKKGSMPQFVNREGLRVETNNFDFEVKVTLSFNKF